MSGYWNKYGRIDYLHGLGYFLFGFGATGKNPLGGGNSHLPLVRRGLMRLKVAYHGQKSSEVKLGRKSKIGIIWKSNNNQT